MKCRCNEGLDYTSYKVPVKKKRIKNNYAEYEKAMDILGKAKNDRSMAYHALGIALADIDQAMLDLYTITGKDSFKPTCYSDKCEKSGGEG